jgi:Rrf2 family nitric oxide-sensitive transcriptional repressor
LGKCATINVQAFVETPGKVIFMQLTAFTDYSLRVLIYLATYTEEKRINIKDISSAYSISNNHLTKVVYKLGKLGYIDTIRGRNGGILLNRQPEEINIGQLIRQTEDHLHIVECFDEQKNSCILSPACHLKQVLNEALNAYLEVLDRYTLADLITNKNLLVKLLQQN